MNENFEKIPPDKKYKFLCYKKVEINIFKYEALKNMWVVTLNYQKHCNDKALLILKMQITIVLSGLILDI